MKHIHRLATTDKIKIRNTLCNRTGGRCALGMVMDVMIRDKPNVYHAVTTSGAVQAKNNPMEHPLNLIAEYLQLSESEANNISLQNNDTEMEFEEIALWITNNVLSETERKYMLTTPKETILT